MPISSPKIKRRITVYMFHWIWSGLISEHEPFISPNKRLFFKKLTKTLNGYFGYRSPRKHESMENYIAAFRDFEYRYRNDFTEITTREKAENISNENSWNPEDNEITIAKTKITM